MSPTLPTPDETSCGRLVTRAAAALAAIGFATSLAVSLARATGAITLADDTFAVLAIWSLSLACLGLGLAAFRGGDPRAARALPYLDYGNPALDDVLDHRNARPAWRARRGIQTACTAAAAAGWLLGIPFSVQIALGVYRIPPVTELFLLGWMLGLALWATVLAASAPGERRRAEAHALACEMHHAQRENRQQAEHAAAQALLDTGEIPCPIQLVRTERREHPRFG